MGFLNGKSSQGLTDREFEVLTLIGEGAGNGEIADTLSISKRTVETHVGHIYVKLGIRGRIQAVLHSIRQGLVNVD